jgi:hypothetical protein
MHAPLSQTHALQAVFSPQSADVLQELHAPAKHSPAPLGPQKVPSAFGHETILPPLQYVFMHALVPGGFW